MAVRAQPRMTVSSACMLVCSRCRCGRRQPALALAASSGASPKRGMRAVDCWGLGAGSGFCFARTVRALKSATPRRHDGETLERALHVLAEHHGKYRYA